MPTASEQARSEAGTWTRIAGHWAQTEVPDVWEDRPPTELAVVVFHDPRDDLERRARDWNHEMAGSDLSELARFAAGLSESEADAWDRDVPDLATRAYEARRFLLGDRILHWAVPWLNEVGNVYPEYGRSAHLDRDQLLGLGDEAKVAPVLPGREGLQAEGEDSYGTVGQESDLDTWLSSLWSGMVVLRHPPTRSRFEASRRQWQGLAKTHPGSAQLWLDLAERAGRTAVLLT